jgi:beta-galactosidase
MGTAIRSDGQRIGINNRYLTLDGRPWLPVMGEFHYARVPEKDWRTELLKMKSAGVDIVSTYVFWNEQEPRAGRFNWNGDLDLRHFVELCKQLGLYVIVRIGPWDHAELRFGGLPDWIVRSMPTRRNDPTYLHQVAGFYQQIADQLRNLWWKNDGPVIGVQIENEYNLRGPGQGRSHIARLKAIARKTGMDVPLYTVTGWDGTVFPKHEVVPVFGGYPDEPWSTSTTALPPKTDYLFRFKTRVSGGNLGAQTPTTGRGDADAVTMHTPFLGAEFGGGVPAMYRRRVVIAPDDIAAMLPVELGSGVNMYGYYMFQGGRNNMGATTLEESTRTGGYNDTPIISYDFQAPLGQYGQERPVLNRIRPFHYFLQTFGDRLAPMTVHVPESVPTSPADLKTLRFSVRSLGDSGFVFVNNHVRQYAMQAHKQVQFAIDLPDGTLRFPSTPVNIPDNAYFIWPFHFEMSGAHLLYATAQPMTRFMTPHGMTYVFVASPGITPEFAFDSGTRVIASSGRIRHIGGITRVNGLTPGLDAYIRVSALHGKPVTVLVLDHKHGDQAWLDRNGSHTRLVLTPDSLYFDGTHAQFRSTGVNRFRFAIDPASASPPKSSLPLRRSGTTGPFVWYEAQAPKRTIPIHVQVLRKALKVPPVRIGGSADAAMQPLPETYGDAAAWTLKLSSNALANDSNAFIDIRYQGDVARLFSGTKLLDDNFYNGQTWSIGLRRFRAHLQKPLTLEVLPLRGDAPIYIQHPYRPKIAHDEQLARLLEVRVKPQYVLDVNFGSGK